MIIVKVLISPNYFFNTQGIKQRENIHPYIIHFYLDTVIR